MEEQRSDGLGPPGQGLLSGARLRQATPSSPSPPSLRATRPVLSLRLGTPRIPLSSRLPT